MPTVPFPQQQVQGQPQGPGKEWLMLAAGDLHAEGRLFEPEGPSKLQAEVIPTGGKVKAAKDPGHAEIEGFPTEEGLFEPIKEHMAGPTKPMADKAVAMTKKLHDLYKAGDTDVVEAVQDFENKTLGRGYADNEAGRALKKESFEKYGSKTEMSRGTKWDTFMSIYGDLMGDMVEREDVSPKDKEAYESMSRFDRQGRTQVMTKKLYEKLR